MFKKWLAVLGAVLLIVGTSPLLLGSGGGEEYPWENTGGRGTGSTGSSDIAVVDSRTVSPSRSIFIVRPAPMGGFYLIRISLPTGAPAKRDLGQKKVQD